MSKLKSTAFALLAWIVAGCTLALAPLPAAAQSQPTDYLLGAGDVITVQVYGQFEGPIQLRIRGDGSIALPLIGAVDANGKVPLRLARDIEQAYIAGGYFENPVINVEVQSDQSRTVTVLGAVRQPGVVPLVVRTTLSSVIAQSGGPTNLADLATLRRADGTELSLTITEIAGTGADPVLQAGDVVIMTESPRYYVYGYARSPGAFELVSGLTFRQALASAGGPSEAGTERDLRLFRNNVESELENLDEPIQAGDVLYVRGRIF